jgi:hypothetical protein
VVAGWSISIAMGLLAMCGPYHMSFPSYQYNPQEAALYNALSPILWGVFLGWVTFAMSTGYAGKNRVPDFSSLLHVFLYYLALT